MAEGDWLRPAVPVEAAGTAWAGPAPARFEVRPLSLGEVLDRTFALYRSRFWLFAGIAMVAASVNAVGQAVSLATAHRLGGQLQSAASQTPAAALMNLRAIAAAQASTYGVLLLFFLVSAVTQAGIALAVTQVYLQKPASAKAALRSVLPRWSRWIGIALWQVGSLAWPPLTAVVPAVLLLAFGARSGAGSLTVIGGILFVLAALAGVPLGIVLYLRNALAIPAAVTEGLPIRAAMRRSKRLAAGTKGRIFVVWLIAFCLLEVVGILETPIVMLMLVAPNQQHYLARGLALLIAFTGHTVVAPVALIGLTLVYFDQRVRQEAFDLQLLLEGVREGGPAAPGETSRAMAQATESYGPLL